MYTYILVCTVALLVWFNPVTSYVFFKDIFITFVLCLWFGAHLKNLKMSMGDRARASLPG